MTAQMSEESRDKRRKEKLLAAGYNAVDNGFLQFDHYRFREFSVLQPDQVFLDCWNSKRLGRSFNCALRVKFRKGSLYWLAVAAQHSCVAVLP